MKSLAIIRATDILKLKSTLLEMNRAGLSFVGKPKEINPASTEKILSKVFESGGNRKFEVCVLIPLAQDPEFSRSKIKVMPHYSDVFIMDGSHELFNNFVKLISMLPDLVIPSVYHKDAGKQISVQKETPSAVYLGVFVNRKVQVQTSSGSMHTGVLKHADSIGVLFEPADNSPPLFITWHDIKKIIIPKEEMK